MPNSATAAGATAPRRETASTAVRLPSLRLPPLRRWGLALLGITRGWALRAGGHYAPLGHLAPLRFSLLSILIWSENTTRQRVMDEDYLETQR